MVDNNLKIFAIRVEKGSFKQKDHFYEKVLANNRAHSLMNKFFDMTIDNMIDRYCILNPKCDRLKLNEYLNYRTKYFKWAGTDLFNVIDNESGKRQMLLIETNTCPSGIKSMPFIDSCQIYGGYKYLIESVLNDFNELNDDDVDGDLAILYDQNKMESSAYSTMMAELTDQNVWLLEYTDDNCEAIKWENDGYMYVKDNNNEWHRIKGCLRYVTKKPWIKIPVNSKTKVINPVLACLAGGRNKIMANYAYDKFNKELIENNSGLSIRLPYSLINVNKNEIPNLLENDLRLNGKAVVKVPYANCGQGVYTILNKHELDLFMKDNHKYDKFIIQSLIGEHSWSKNEQQYYHIGTVPDENNNVFVFDLRMIVTSDKNGFRPVSMNCRRARKPLTKDLSNLDQGISSWDMLGTNLSIKLGKTGMDTDPERLLIMDNNDFNTLGLGIDDLIDAYIQTILSVISIDKMCIELFDESNDQNKFNVDLFRQLNPDESLLNEIRHHDT